jgi:hypothetical protein
MHTFSDTVPEKTIMVTTDSPTLTVPGTADHLITGSIIITAGRPDQGPGPHHPLQTEPQTPVGLTMRKPHGPRD